MGTSHVRDLNAGFGEMIMIERRQSWMDVHHHIISFTYRLVCRKEVECVDIVPAFSDAFREFLHLPRILVFAGWRVCPERFRNVHQEASFVVSGAIDISAN